MLQERGDEKRGIDEIDRLLGEVNLNIDEDSLDRVHVATEKFVKGIIDYNHFKYNILSKTEFKMTKGFGIHLSGYKSRSYVAIKHYT